MFIRTGFGWKVMGSYTSYIFRTVSLFSPGRKIFRITNNNNLLDLFKAFGHQFAD